MIKEIYKLWNGNFKKGLTIFQIFLMGFMVIGAMQNNKPLILFSMTVCLFGYFEPNQDRFSFVKESKEVR